MNWFVIGLGLILNSSTIDIATNEVIKWINQFKQGILINCIFKARTHSLKPCETPSTCNIKLRQLNFQGKSQLVSLLPHIKGYKSLLHKDLS